MTSDRFTLDTNVLVYAIDADAERRHEISRDLVFRARERECVLTLRSLAEFYNVMTRKRRMAKREAAAIVEEWTQSFFIVAADQETFAHAAQADQAHGLSFWDAMLWATARTAGCRLVITEDYQTGREVDGVLFVNPFATPDLPPEIERVLAPR